MTRRGPCPQPRLRSSPLWKGVSMTGAQNLRVTKKLARGKGTVLFCRNSPCFWSPRQPRFGLQMQPTSVRECRWIRPSWNGYWWGKDDQKCNCIEYFIISLIYKWAYFHKTIDALCVESNFYLRSGSSVLLLRRVRRHPGH